MKKDGNQFEHHGDPPYLAPLYNGYQFSKIFLELKIPFDDFDGAPADKVQYQIKLFRNKKLIEKWPKEELIECEIPGPEFEKIEWRV